MKFYEYLTLLDLDEWFDADDDVKRGVVSRFHPFESLIDSLHLLNLTYYL